jgi:tRNA1(Val) A37 N6-methylase TrmN6
MTRDKSTKNLIASIQKNKPYLTEIKVAKQVFNLYYGGISIFRPTTAARLYKKYCPQVGILDFTMGWGGRMMGACALNVVKYIGVDYNTNLEEPYTKMKNFIQENGSHTEIELYFQDALTVDYSALDYDMVATSPPFYNKEIYGGKDTYKTLDDWDDKFYIPIMRETWKHLKSGGTYCLNVPVQLYERVCIPILGHAQEQIELKKYQRVLPKQKENAKQTNVGQKYKEYIYVWIKL